MKGCHIAMPGGFSAAGIPDRGKHVLQWSSLNQLRENVWSKVHLKIPLTLLKIETLF